MDSVKTLKYYEGDYIKLNGDDTVYEFVRIDRPWLYVKYLNKDVIVNTSIQNICPIELTEEFLYKNSYSVYKHPDYTQYALNELYVVKEVDGIFSINGIKIKYIHELQHMTDIIGIDKTLEL